MFTFVAVEFKSYLGLVSSWSRVHLSIARWTQEDNVQKYRQKEVMTLRESRGDTGRAGRNDVNMGLGYEILKIIIKILKTV